jgi:hypothetical protein
MIRFRVMAGRVIWMARRESARVRAAIAGAAFAVLAGAGCASFSLRASEARTPILLGPVACMRCAPEPARAVSPPAVVGGIREREYVIAVVLSFAANPKTQDTASLAVAATKAVPDPCREDLRVSSIQTGAWYFDVPLVFAMGDAWIDVQASRAAVTNGSCGHTSSQSPDAAKIVAAARETPRNGRRP